MTKEKLREKSDTELAALCESLKKEIFEDRNRRLLDKEAKTASKSLEARRNIARAMTILRERELQSERV